VRQRYLGDGRTRQTDLKQQKRRRGGKKKKEESKGAPRAKEKKNDRGGKLGLNGEFKRKEKPPQATRSQRWGGGGVGKGKLNGWKGKRKIRTGGEGQKAHTQKQKKKGGKRKKRFS